MSNLDMRDFDLYITLGTTTMEQVLEGVYTSTTTYTSTYREFYLAPTYSIYGYEPIKHHEFNRHITVAGFNILVKCPTEGALSIVLAELEGYYSRFTDLDITDLPAAYATEKNLFMKKLIERRLNGTLRRVDTRF